MSGLEMWTVYERPADYPGEYVARKWVVDHSSLEPIKTNDIRRAPTLGALRALLPPGLVRLPASDGDEPQILETWL